MALKLKNPHPVVALNLPGQTTYTCCSEIRRILRPPSDLGKARKTRHLPATPVKLAGIAFIEMVSERAKFECTSSTTS